MAMLSVRNTATRIRAILVLVGLIGAVFPAWAEIRYSVTASTEPPALQVQMDIPVSGKAIVLKCPNWAPGSYRLADYSRNIQDLKAEGAGGLEVAVEKTADNAWQVTPLVDDRTVTVRYRVPVPLTDGAMHYSGPATYLYVDGRKTEPCRLTLSVPAGWKVAVGLDEVRGQEHTYTAPNYDVLADNPVSMGNLIVDQYVAFGKPHFIVLRNAAKSDVDLAYLKRACKFVTESQGAFFGGVPYNKYVWHFSVNDSPDGAGGLEHLSSTQISLASGVGPRAVSVLSHEFFHLWNVKRIRSKPLGPFDYDVLPTTGALWWLEGVTDYYAHLLLYRYGWWDRGAFESDILNNWNGVRSNPARLEVSPYEASARVKEAANGRGNSNGYRVSYYNTGWLCGLLLDIEIRSASKGKHSLDDVTRALWQLCKDDKPGFEEGEIRALCVKYGGDAAGAFYDQIITKPGELPVDAQLAKIGLRIAELRETFTDVGFTASPSRQSQSSGGVVRNVHGPAENLLQNGDVLIAVDGVRLDTSSNRKLAASLDAALKEAKVGVPLRLRLKRGESEVNVAVTPVEATRSRQVVEDIPDASAEVAQLRSQFLKQAKL
jgi:predicted metalloprotease with PDZ domain